MKHKTQGVSDTLCVIQEDCRKGEKAEKDRTFHPDREITTLGFFAMFPSRLGELKFSTGPENATAVTEFILEGFSGLDQRLQLFLSLVLLIIYLTTVTGNATIMFLVCLDHHLQTPMYFSISNLSFL